jgi:hypothetical protein
MLPHQALNENKGVLRFMVPMGNNHVTAYLSEATWQAAKRESGRSHSSMLDIYLKNRPLIDDSVLRRVHSGARSPVVLMASDL